MEELTAWKDDTVAVIAQFITFQIWASKFHSFVFGLYTFFLVTVEEGWLVEVCEVCLD